MEFDRVADIMAFMRWWSNIATRARIRSNRGRNIVKKFWLLASIVGLWCGPALSQTMDELLNDGKNTDNVLTLSMGFDRKSYSPLNQINKNNVKRLVPVWSTSLMNDMGELAAHVVHNRVIYAINRKWSFALDDDTGHQVWHPARQRCAQPRR